MGLPFVWIGGGAIHQVMYDRRDADAFIAKREADPSIGPVIPKGYVRDTRASEQRKADRARRKVERDLSNARIGV